MTHLTWFALMALLVPALFATEMEQQSENSSPIGELLEAENNGTLNWIIVDSGNTEDGDGGQRNDEEDNDGSDKRRLRDTVFLNHSGETWFALNQQSQQAWLSSLQQGHEWQLNRPTGGFELLNLIANDRGQVWLIGRFPGQLTWKDQMIHSSGQEDLFVARVSAEGQLDWLRQVGTAGFESLLRVEVQQDGFIHLKIRSAQQHGPVLQDSLTVSGSELFSMMLDSKGKMSWVERSE